MESALVYMWAGTRPGLEAAGMAQYRETTANLTQLQAEGKIRDFAWYLAGQCGPHLCIVRGEAEALLAISLAPEAMASNMKSAIINEGYQWGLYATGDAVDAMLGHFVQTTEQLNA